MGVLLPLFVAFIIAGLVTSFLPLIITLLLTLAVALTQREALNYSPYPHLELPQFNPFVGLGILGLLVPAIVAISQDDARMHSTNGVEQETL